MQNTLPAPLLAATVPQSAPHHGGRIQANSDLYARAQEAESWGDDGFGFDDFLDMINPLQHIPVLSTLYREHTGDNIAPAAQVVGGGIFGGVLGIASNIVQAIAQEVTHNDGTQSGNTLAPHTEPIERPHREPRYSAYPTSSHQARIYERMDRFS